MYENKIIKTIKRRKGDKGRANMIKVYYMEISQKPIVQ
jgi:hypothetical protein